jgi:hypothetical protein
MRHFSAVGDLPGESTANGGLWKGFGRHALSATLYRYKIFSSIIKLREMRKRFFSLCVSSVADIRHKIHTKSSVDVSFRKLLLCPKLLLCKSLPAAERSLFSDSDEKTAHRKLLCLIPADLPFGDIQIEVKYISRTRMIYLAPLLRPVISKYPLKYQNITTDDDIFYRPFRFPEGSPDLFTFYRRSTIFLLLAYW